MQGPEAFRPCGLCHIFGAYPDESRRPGGSTWETPKGGLLCGLIVSEFISLDGVVEAPGGEPGYKHSGWVVPFTGQEQLQYKLDEVLEAEALLLGRVTYEGFAEAWPPRSDEAGFADKMNSMPKYVASTTLAVSSRGTTRPCSRGTSRRRSRS